MLATALPVLGMAPTKGPDPPPPGSDPNDEAVLVVARDLGRHAGPLPEDERLCLDGLLDSQPSLREALLRSGSVVKLDTTLQQQLFSDASRCAPVAVGRALHAVFLSVSNRKTGMGAVTPGEYGCLGGSVSPALATMLQLERRAPTRDEMSTFATALYLCAPAYLTGGPLAQSLRVPPGRAACVANRIAGGLTSLVPEVSRILFAQRNGRRSTRLRQVIADCRTSSAPRTQS
jgi:hypothetical protein